MKQKKLSKTDMPSIMIHGGEKGSMLLVAISRN